MAANDEDEIVMEVDGSLPKMETVDGKTAFLKNLSQHFKSDSLSDVTLVVDNKRYPAHKLILAVSSTYFHRMFYGGDWKEGKEQDVKLEETPACEEVFPVFLQYFYSGSISVNKETVVPLVTLADKYDVKVFKELCSQFMTNVIDQGDIEVAITWLSFAEQMSMEFLAKRCFDVICFNLEKASSFPCWLSLSLAQIIVILKRSDIVVPSEYTVYMAIHSWLVANEKVWDRVCEILPHIQFKNMTAQELVNVEKTIASSSTNSSVKDQINTSVLAGFRHVLIAKEGVEVGDQVVPLQRLYMSGNSMQTAIFLEGCCLLCPTCPGSSEPKKYKWQLQKSSASKYQITLPSVNRTEYFSGGFGGSVSRPEFSFGGFGGTSDKLIDHLPGTIHVALSIVFRDSGGVVYYVINHSVDTTIPPSNGGTLLELPSLFNISERNAKDLFTPHDILYSFRILKKE